MKAKLKEELGPISLQEGTEKDLDAFFVLEKKLAGPTYWPETKKEDVYGDNKFFYLVKAGEKIVGQIMYEQQNDNTIYLSLMGIEPEFQGRGLGRQTMKLFMSKVATASKVWLVVHPDNKTAISLYESFGFAITERKENYFGNGMPRMVMVLKT